MHPYIKPSREMVLNAINIENGLQNDPLTFEQIALGQPQVITTPNSKRNTRLLVYSLMKRGYKGNVTITFNRYSMENLFRGVTVVVIGDPVAKLSDILPAFNKATGIVLLPDDIVDKDVSKLGLSWVTDLVVRPGCVAYTGKVTVRYAQDLPRLIDIIHDNVLDAIRTRLAVADKPRAEYVGYSFDWSKMRQHLNGLTLGTTATQELADRLNEVIPLKFTTKPATEITDDSISLNGAIIRRREDVVAGGLYNTSYQRVVVLEMSAASNYNGELFLHYDPVE